MACATRILVYCLSPLVLLTAGCECGGNASSGDADVDTDVDSDVDTDADTDVDADADTDTDTDADADTDTDADADTDTDVDADTDADTDTDSDTDTDTDTSGEPSIESHPPVVEFGWVFPGTTREEYVGLYNVGDAPLVISALALSAETDAERFGVRLVGPWELPASVAPLDFAPVEVWFSPQIARDCTAEGELIVTSNDPDTPELAIRLWPQCYGSPNIEVDPVRLDWISVPPGATNTRSFTIRNSGTLWLEITELEVSDGEANFRLAEDTPEAPFDVEANDELRVDVEYTAPDDERHAGIVVIRSIDRDTPEVRVILQANPGAVTLLGTADLTYYWVAFEGDHDGPADTELRTCDHEAIATVSRSFAEAARLEGTARLLDDRTINIDCDCTGGFDCFVVLDQGTFPWGVGSRDNPLVPFASIATDTDVIPWGTVLYAPDLVGLELPDGFGTHDGCLRADDVGWGVTGWHIDWFVALREHYLALDPDVPEELDLYTVGTACDHL